LRYLARCQQTVIKLGRLPWNAQDERWFRQTLHVAGAEAVGGKTDDPIVGERCTFHIGLARLKPEMNIGSGNAGIPGDCIQPCATALLGSEVALRTFLLDAAATIALSSISASAARS
jgi:hypothetical protein